MYVIRNSDDLSSDLFLRMAKEIDPSRIKPCIFTLRGVKVILPVN